MKKKKSANISLKSGHNNKEIRDGVLHNAGSLSTAFWQMLVYCTPKIFEVASHDMFDLDSAVLLRRSPLATARWPPNMGTPDA